MAGYLKSKKIAVVFTILGSFLVIGIIILYLIAGGAHPVPEDTPVFKFNISNNKKSSIHTPIAVATYPLEAKPDIASFLNLPESMSVSGNYFALNAEKGLIDVFDYKSNLLNSFSSWQNQSKNNVYFPKHISIDDSGKIYISANTSFIAIYNRSGKFLYRIPSLNMKTNIKKSAGIFIKDNKLFVVDVAESKIKIFDLNGKLILKFGGEGRKSGKFKFPDSVAVNNKGLVYVSDSGNARIQIFNSKGKLKSVIGRKSGLEFMLPRGIAIDPWQRVHVVDSYAHQVNVLDEKGRYLFSYGGSEKGTGKGQFNYPSGIAINQRTGRIFIADYGNRRISVWDY